MPEDSESDSMIKFVEDLLTTQRPLPDGISLQIQCAHRALSNFFAFVAFLTFLFLLCLAAQVAVGTADNEKCGCTFSAILVCKQ